MPRRGRRTNRHFRNATDHAPPRTDLPRPVRHVTPVNHPGRSGSRARSRTFTAPFKKRSSNAIFPRLRRPDIEQSATHPLPAPRMTGGSTSGSAEDRRPVTWAAAAPARWGNPRPRHRPVRTGWARPADGRNTVNWSSSASHPARHRTRGFACRHCSPARSGANCGALARRESRHTRATAIPRGERPRE
jgi:hypothetical protein